MLDKGTRNHHFLALICTANRTADVDLYVAQKRSQAKKKSHSFRNFGVRGKAVVIMGGGSGQGPSCCLPSSPVQSYPRSTTGQESGDGLAEED